MQEFARRIGPGAFDALSRGDIAEGLIERIKDPGLLNQAQANTCGPATFLFSVASDDPVMFARFGTDLFEQGQANIGKLHVEPDAEVVHAPPLAPQITEVDWMLMASLRDSENWFFDFGTG